MLPAQSPSRPAAIASGRGPLARVLTGLWMALHLLVVAAVPLADAQTLHADEVVAHWESEGAECPTSHGADDCQLCQLLVAGRALPATATAPALPARPAARIPSGLELAAVAAAHLDGLGSRAPPRA